MKKLKETFKVKDKELAVNMPSPKILTEATKIQNKTFSEAVASGAMLKAKLQSVLQKQDIYDEDEMEKTRLTIAHNEKKLKEGNIRLSEAKDTAFAIRNARAKRRELMVRYNELEQRTAEAQAENARFNYLVYACTVYNDTGKRYYDSYEVYESADDGEVSGQAATILMKMIYGLDADFEQKLVENAFLKKYHFMDDKLRLINKDNHLVDEEGRLINDNGRYIDKDGNLIDIDGNKVDETGDLVVEFKPFLDDDGKPIPEPVDEKKRGPGRPRK